MVGVAVVGSICENNFRLAPTNDFYDSEQVLLGILEKSIGQAKVSTERSTHFLGGLGSFHVSKFGGAPAAQLATGKVKQPH